MLCRVSDMLETLSEILVVQMLSLKDKMKIEEISVMSDHIHAVVEIPPTMSVSQALHLLKGASSRELFKQKPNFRKRYPRGHFWSPGKFYRSIGDTDTETVIQYVKDQQLEQTSLDSMLTAA